MDENKLDDEFVFDDQLDAIAGEFLNEAQIEAIADGIVSHSCVDVNKYLKCIKDTGNPSACKLENCTTPDADENN